MANHTRLPIKEKIKINNLKEIIEKIVKNKFKDYLKVNINKKEKTLWISIKNPKVEWFKPYNELALIWINKKGDIEFRHGHGDEGWWIETVIEKELIKYFNIKKIDDDGVGWIKAEEIKEYPTFRSWREIHFEREKKKNGEYPFMIKRIINKGVKQSTKISDVFGDDLNG